MDFKQQLNQINLELNQFVNFVLVKLKNFPRLSLGEQISYPVIGLGFILIITAIVMFVI